MQASPANPIPTTMRPSLLVRRHMPPTREEVVSSPLIIFSTFKI